MSANFLAYYDENWLPRGDYFAHHRNRFLQTFTALENIYLIGGNLLDIGGIGPVADYLVRFYRWAPSHTSTDLRGALPQEDNFYDLILCTETIEHIKDIDSNNILDLEAFNYSGVKNMLREIGRIIKSDGHLLISTPNACSMLTLNKWLRGEVLLMDPSHVREFTPNELNRVLSVCGFSCSSLNIVNSWTSDIDFQLGLQLSSFISNRFDGCCHIDRGDNIIALYRPT